MKALITFLRDDDATTATEYAVMLAGIILVAIASISVFGGEAGGIWGGIRQQLDDSGF